MDWKTELITVAINLVLVLAGAAAGALGGYVASVHGQNRISEREKLKEKRANLLAVTLEVSKVLTWAEKYATYCASCSVEQFTSASQNPPTQVEANPMQTIQAIASLYFPEIVADARQLSIAGSQHYIAAHELLLARYGVDHGNRSQKDVEKEQKNVQGAFMNLCAKQAKFEKATQELMAKLLSEEESSNKKT
ncbi:MAG: hypothetical protein MPJ22_09500 [Pirellulales bacterium]|nr:hypothetical protein [Gammaproteobacteria bacterium]MDA8010382.1 hypothetical protein [Alphaproteobacteria bacterium]MDA8031893.1 hypothetical protein [Alphaproteobacteria bacterium]MDA8042638.1 hypothetical protein [Pirellulales bacterium]